MNTMLILILDRPSLAGNTFVHGPDMFPVAQDVGKQGNSARARRVSL